MNNAYLQYVNDELTFGLKNQTLKKFTQDYTSPLYVYDLEILRDRAQRLKKALPSFNLHYAVKANFHPQVLQALKAEGFKVDTVSWGEAARALENGFKPEDVVFSGVGKTVSEIDNALKTGIFQINIESASELKRIQERAENLKKKISVAFRINPDVDIKTHPYIATGLSENKFGISLSDLPALQEQLKKSSFVQLKGLTMHLGSQMHDLGGMEQGLTRLKQVFTELKQAIPTLERFDIGGGLGIYYEEENLEKDLELLDSYGKLVQEKTKDLKLHFQTEPGRWLVARAGGLITQVQYIKFNGHKKFVIVDGGMNLLMRPTLYSAYHRILPLKKRPGPVEKVDVVGPICESSDFFAKDRELPPIEEGDFLWVADAGAYGAVMASNYNLQPPVKEIFI